MYPLQSHEIRAMREARALREAQQARMISTVQVRRRLSLPALLAHVIMLGLGASDRQASYFPSPC